MAALTVVPRLDFFASSSQRPLNDPTPIERPDGSGTQRTLLYGFTWLSEFCGFLLIFAVTRELAQTGASLLEMGILGGGMSLTLSTSCILSGRLSDRIGRRQVMGVGLVLLILSVLGCRLIDKEHSMFYASYWAAGVALGFIYPSLYAWLSVTRRYPHASGIGRTILFFCLMWNLGLICGQLAGGWLFKASDSGDWPLHLSIALAFLSMLLLRVIGPSPAPKEYQEAPDSEAHGELPNQALSAAFAKLAWLANLGGTFSMSMVIHLFPKLAVQAGIPPDQHGMILALSRVVVIAMYFALFYFSFWHHRVGPALAVQVLGAVGLLVISYSREPAGFILGLACLAQLSGFNYFASLYYSTAGSTHDRRGAASGVHEATLALGMAGGCILGGVAGQLGDLGTPYRLGAIVVFSLAIAQILVYFRQVRRLRSALVPTTER